MIEPPRPGRQPHTDIDRFIGAIPVVMFVTVGLWLLFIQRPDPLPPAKSLYGCFSAEGVPSLWFRNGNVHVAQAGFQDRPFRFAWEKWAPLVVKIDPGLVLTRTTNGYAFIQGHVPTSESRLTHVVDGKPYGVLHPEDAQAIEIDDQDDHLITLGRAPSNRCPQ